MSQELLCDVKDGIATITINRPEQRNAVTYEMWKRLGPLAAALDADRAVRVVILRGAGTQAFSSPPIPAKNWLM